MLYLGMVLSNWNIIWKPVVLENTPKPALVARSAVSEILPHWKYPMTEALPESLYHWPLPIAYGHEPLGDALDVYAWD